MKKIKLSFILLFVFVSLLSIYAQNKLLNYYNLFDIKFVAETVISPDGNYIAYTLNIPRTLSEAPGGDYRELHIFDLKNKTSKALISGSKSVFSVSWGSDSKTIYFLFRPEGAKANQICTIGINGGTPKALTDMPNAVTMYSINPNGKNIAFISTEPTTSAKKKLLDKGFDAEIYEEEFSDLNLYIYDFSSKTSKRITSNFSVFDFVWSPQGDQIAAAIADKNLVDDSFMFKRIFLLDPANGSKVKLVENPGKLGSMAFSPNGENLAFISAVDVEDPVGGNIFVININKPLPFTELFDHNKNFIGHAVNIQWKDNETFYYMSEEGVDITIREQKINMKESNLVLEGGKVVFGAFDYNNGMFTFAGSTWEHPSELFTFDINNKLLTKLTNYNSWLSEYKLGKQEKITYKARDGLEIEGVLIYPVDFEEGKRYPLINSIHGGPETCIKNGWLTSYGNWGQFAAAKGYFVFNPNYRASSGRGVEFSKMDRGDLVGAEFDDVVDGVDYLINKGYVDEKRVGIGGGSYGGYFSMWGATKETKKFQAAVAFVGISNQISKAFTTDIPYEDYHVHWGIWPHENWDLYLDRSPIKYARQSITPTLILHGKDDPRVHPAQSLEMYRALKTHGKAPVRLVWYPGEGHGNRKSTSKLDYLIRTMEWFDFYLDGGKPKTQLPPKYLEINFD